MAIQKRGSSEGLFIFFSLLSFFNRKDLKGLRKVRKGFHHKRHKSKTKETKVKPQMRRFLNLLICDFFLIRLICVNLWQKNLTPTLSRVEGAFIRGLSSLFLIRVN